MQRKMIGGVLLGLILGFILAGVSFIWVDRQYIQQKAVMTLVQSGISNPAVQDLLAGQVVRYLKSPEGTREMMEYLKRPEIAQVLADHLESPEFRPHVLRLMQRPEIRKAFVTSLSEEPEFKILQALSKFTAETSQEQESRSVEDVKK